MGEDFSLILEQKLTKANGLWCTWTATRFFCFALLFNVHYLMNCDIPWNERIAKTVLRMGKIRARNCQRADSSS